MDLLLLIGMEFKRIALIRFLTNITYVLDYVMYMNDSIVHQFFRH